MSSRSTTDYLRHAALNEKQERLKDRFTESVGLRIHRSISWVGRAEREADDDARFIFLWIGFNAAYADGEDFRMAPIQARTAFKGFFEKVEALDAHQRVYDAIWNNFTGPIRMLLHNQYVFGPFWQHQIGIQATVDWRTQFQYATNEYMRAMQRQQTGKILCLLFDRLYVLRNQIMHGGATWNSSLNRDQVRDGSAILRFLVPEFIDIMMDNPQEDWGCPLYPVVK